MNIAESLAIFLQGQSIATIGQDMFISAAPSSKKAPEALYWLEASGGDSLRKLKTNGKMKSYLVEIRYRNVDKETVYNKMHELEELLNSGICTSLSGFDTVEIEATTFPVDDDLESEDRKVGLLQATLTILKEY